MDFTANCARIINAHVTIRVLPVTKCVAYAEGNRTDYQLRLDQSGPEVIKLFSYSYSNSYSVIRVCARLSFTLKTEVKKVFEYYRR